MLYRGLHLFFLAVICSVRGAECLILAATSLPVWGRGHMIMSQVDLDDAGMVIDHEGFGPVCLLNSGSRR